VSRLVHAAGTEAGLEPVNAAGAAGASATQPVGSGRAVGIRIAVDPRTCDVAPACAGAAGLSPGNPGERSRDEPRGDEAPAMAY
jgi:hypothetical protein